MEKSLSIFCDVPTAKLDTGIPPISPKTACKL